MNYIKNRLIDFYIGLNIRKGSYIDDCNSKKLIDNLFGNTTILKEPFKHIVIDNFLPAELNEKLIQKHEEILNRGYSISKSNTKYSPFLDIEKEYDGYHIGLNKDILGKDFYFLFSASWLIKLSYIMNKKLINIVNCAFHYHEPLDRDGWVHNDNTNKLKLKNNKNNYENILINPLGINIKKDEIKTKNHISCRRAIAVIYYFGRNKIDGGGTGLFEKEDSIAPIKIIEPVNNRILIFEISDKSFHAFRKNYSNRASLIQFLFTKD